MEKERGDDGKSGGKVVSKSGLRSRGRKSIGKYKKVEKKGCVSERYLVLYTSLITG